MDVYTCMYMHYKPLNVEMILTLAVLISEAVHDSPYLYTMYLYSERILFACNKATKNANFLSTQKNNNNDVTHVHVDHLTLTFCRLFSLCGNMVLYKLHIQKALMYTSIVNI